MSGTKIIICLAMVAICVTMAIARPHHGKKHKDIMKFACKVTNTSSGSDDPIRTRNCSCGDNETRTCSWGPVNVTGRFGESLSLMFCDELYLQVKVPGMDEDKLPRDNDGKGERIHTKPRKHSSSDDDSSSIEDESSGEMQLFDSSNQDDFSGEMAFHDSSNQDDFSGEIPLFDSSNQDDFSREMPHCQVARHRQGKGKGTRPDEDPELPGSGEEMTPVGPNDDPLVIQDNAGASPNLGGDNDANPTRRRRPARISRRGRPERN